GRGGPLRRPGRVQQERGRQGDLDRLGRAGPVVGELLDGQLPLLADSAGHGERVVPYPVFGRVFEVNTRALDQLRTLELADDLIEEREPPELSVGDHVEPDALLHGDRLIDRAVLDPLELWCWQLASLVCVASLLQVLGPEQ